MISIQKLVQEIDKEQYLKELEAKSKKSKKDVQQRLDKLNKQMDVLKVRKRKFHQLCSQMKKSIMMSI
jgi:site-specific DNA recombinase